MLPLVNARKLSSDKKSLAANRLGLEPRFSTLRTTSKHPGPAHADSFTTRASQNLENELSKKVDQSLVSCQIETTPDRNKPTNKIDRFPLFWDWILSWLFFIDWQNPPGKLSRPRQTGPSSQ
jgi:hypothetical protein